MGNHRTKLAIVALLGAVSLLAPACGGPSAGSAQATDDQLVLTGSSTIAPLAAEIGKRFEERNPGVRVDVQTGGSSRGIADARQGTADIGMVSRALKEEEKDLLAYAVARDGISLIVHESSPVRTLDYEQVRDVYTGKITDWDEVGGRSAPITVVNKAEGRSTLELFLEYFGLQNTDIEADVVIGDNEQGIKTVAGNPASIGYVSIGTAEYDRDLGVPIRLLPVEGVEATSENVRNGTFPISRPLNLVTNAPPKGLTKRFVDFARSEDVQDIVEEQSFVRLPE